MARPKRTGGASEADGRALGDGGSVRVCGRLEDDGQPDGQAGGPQVGASKASGASLPAAADVRAARLERARQLVEEVRQAGRTQGRPYDRDVLRLVEAVLEVAAGQG